MAEVTQVTSDAVFTASIVGFALGAVAIILIVGLMISYCVSYRRHEMTDSRHQEHMKYVQRYASQSNPANDFKRGAGPDNDLGNLGMVNLADVSSGSGRYYLTDGTNSLVVGHVPQNNQSQQHPIVDRLWQGHASHA